MTQPPPPPMPPTPPASTPPSSAAKKTSPWVWVLAGCGGLLLVGFLVSAALTVFVFNKAKEAVTEIAAEVEANPAKAAAELVVRLNPDLELVESDEAAGTITIRDKTSGKTATFNYEDIREGRFSFETDEGKFEVDATGGEDGAVMKMTTEEGVRSWGTGEAPAWVPLHPDAGEVQGSFVASGPEGQQGSVAFQVPAQPDAVLEHYKSTLPADGWEIQNESRSSAADGVFANVTARRSDGGRGLQISILGRGDGTQVNIVYSDRP